MAQAFFMSTAADKERAIVVLDIYNRTIMDVDDNAAQMLDGKPEELVGSTFTLAMCRAMFKRTPPVNEEARGVKWTSGTGEELLDGRPAIDEAEFSEMMSGDRKLMKEVASLFLGNYMRRIKLLEDAIRMNDPKSLMFVAHALKGSVSSIAAERAVELTVALEKFGEEESLEGARELSDELIEEMKRIAQFFREKVLAKEPG